MSFRTKAFLGILFILSSFSHVATGLQDDGISDLDWYKSFFYDGRQEPIEEVIGLASRKLEQASEAQDMAGKVKALKALGLIHLTRTRDYEKAMNFLIKSLAIEDSLSLKEKQVFTFLGIAKVFEEVGDYNKSVQFLQDALKINDQFRDPNILVLILNELGKVHAAKGLIDAAFENYSQVLEYKDQIEQPTVEADALFNLAHLYQLQGNYDKALDNYKSALVIRRSLKDKKNEARTLNDIGELYRVRKNYEKALANHVVALEIRQALKDQKAIAESYNNIGILFFQQKNFQRAIPNLQLALKAGQESQAQEQQSKSYEYLSQSYAETGDYERAFENEKHFADMNDFIQQNKNEHQLLETQNRYVIDSKESEIGKLESDRVQREKEIEAQKKFRNVLIASIVLTLIIVVLIFFLYVLKRKSNKVLQAANQRVQEQNLQLQDLNATKDKFFSIISHDLKGPLNSLTAFSGLLIHHLDSMSKEEIKMLAVDLDKSTKNLFALLENLLEWSRSQTGNIEFKPQRFNISTLLEQNKELLTIQAQNKKIELGVDAINEFAVVAHKNSINTVIRNLLSNAIKFTPEGGKITLDAVKMDSVIRISITDTGVGMSEDSIQKLFRIDTKHSTKGTANEKGTGLGLILCKEFVEKNGGKIWVESEIGKGSSFYFSIPASHEEVKPLS